MTEPVQFLHDDRGIAVLGPGAEIDALLAREGLPARDLGLGRAGALLRTAGMAAGAAAELRSSSGRWVQLTERSAAALREYQAMAGSTAGSIRGVVTDGGRIKEILEFTRGPGGLLAAAGGPSLVATLMVQVAIQQAVADVTDYLEAIDAKVGELLRGQRDAVLADLTGAGLLVDEALAVRDRVGNVSEVTWSKVQGTAMVVTRTQAYALRRIDGAARALAALPGSGDTARATREVEADVPAWLGVLARCFQIQDSLTVLEVDRVLETAPGELDRHRLALKAVRAERLDLVLRSTGRLLDGVREATGAANSTVLRHPFGSPSAVRSGNQVARAVAGFHRAIGAGDETLTIDAVRWGSAAGQVRDRALAAGKDGIGAARTLGSGSRDRVVAAGARVSSEVLGRRRRGRPAIETVEGTTGGTSEGAGTAKGAQA